MIIDIGNAISDTVVALTFIMKKNSTTTTMIAPSNSDDVRFDIDLSIKSRWANMSVEISNSDGNVFFASDITLSKFSVSLIVPTPGCFVTVITTAGEPQYDPIPTRGILPPTATSAISLTVTIPLLSDRTTLFPISANSVVDTSALTTYSLPYPSIIPPALLALTSRNASNTSLSVTPR